MHLVRNESGAMLQSLMLGLVITVGISVVLPAAAERYFGGAPADPSGRSSVFGPKVYQGKTIADMRSIGTASVGFFLEAVRYPERLEELVEAGYLDGVVPTDGWGNDWGYETDGRHFVLVSNGSDGLEGPPPPASWTAEPYEPDLILRDGVFVQTPDRSRGFERLTEDVHGAAGQQESRVEKADKATRGQ